MDNRLWINLTVKDLQAAQAFYEQAGFLLPKADSSNAQQAAFYLEGQRLYVMLFPEDSFKSFTQQEIADTSIGSKVLFSLSQKPVKKSITSYSASNRQTAPSLRRRVNEMACTERGFQMATGIAGTFS
ncbi:VOC family protein [Planococcus plakortidis]